MRFECRGLTFILKSVCLTYFLNRWVIFLNALKTKLLNASACRACPFKFYFSISACWFCEHAASNFRLRRLDDLDRMSEWCPVRKWRRFLTEGDGKG